MTVLIVEDRPEMVDFLKRLLQPIARAMSHTDKLAEAILDRTDNTDLITLDLNLTDSSTENTIQKIHEIKAHNPKAVVVVLSGVITKEDMDRVTEKVLAEGADGFMMKSDIASPTTFFENLKQIARSIISKPTCCPANIDAANKLLGKVTNYLSSYKESIQ